MEWGMVNSFVPPYSLAAETEKMARQNEDKPPVTVAQGKRAFYAQMDLGLAKAYELASATIACSFAHLEGQAGMDAFIEKRPPPGKKH
jgi:enoyl-CoA hydratase/carnithine racemase